MTISGTPVSRAEQAMWQARALLGFDNDGDQTPAAVIAGMGRAGYCQMFLSEIAEFADEHQRYCDCEEP